jgi:hypothetical protein
LWTLRRSCFEPDVAADYLDREENGSRSQLLTYIRLPDAAGAIVVVAASHDGFSRASTSSGAKALAEAMPVQTPGSGSDGVTVSPSSANRLQLLGETDRSFHLGFAFRLRQPGQGRRTYSTGRRFAMYAGRPVSVQAANPSDRP